MIQEKKKQTLEDFHFSKWLDRSDK